MNQNLHRKNGKVNSLPARAFFFTITILLMLGLSSAPLSLNAQQASGDVAENTETPKADEVSWEDGTTEIFGQEYNAQELEVLKKLSPDQLQQFLMQKEQLEFESHNSIDWEEMIIAPLIVGMVFITPVFIVGCLVYFSYREKQLVHASIAKMVEKGVEIPPHLLIQEKKQKESNPNTDLKKALILLSVGVSVSLFFFYIPDAREEGAWSLGLIPFFIGLAYLSFWKLDKPRRKALPTGLSE